MSLNVLVIPEDFRKDQFVLKPLFEKLFKSIGRKARVEVCKEPLLGGVSEALKWERIQEILDLHRGMVHGFLLIVDRDQNVTRRKALDQLELQAARALPPGRWFLGECAWEEIEVWLLAGHSLPPAWKWREVRGHAHPKEAYYEVFARERGVIDAPAQGRPALGREAAANYSRIRKLCPEFGELHRRIEQAVTTNT